MTTLDLVRDFSHGPLLSDSARVSIPAQERLGRWYLTQPATHQLLRSGPLPVKVQAAWRAMAHETMAQLRLLTSPTGLGMTMDVTSEDPYASPAEMFADVEENRHISVLSTESTGGHPYFSNLENDAFRAVHDVFGHFAAQRGFDRHGEEAAYRRHALMFTPLARLAMATETRGQNAALQVRGEFAPEKLIILPEWARMDYALVPETPAEHRAANVEADEYTTEHKLPRVA